MASEVDTQSTIKPQKKKKKKIKHGHGSIKSQIGSVSIKLHRIKKFDPNRGQEALKKAGWFVNRRGKVVGLQDGQYPQPNDQPETYLVQQYVSFVLTDPEYYNFRCIEIKEDRANKVAASVIYVSREYHLKKTVMLVIPGTGIVNAGEFATSVCKFDNLIIGTAFPFIEWALDHDIGVVLFDPNGMSKHHENVLDKIHCVHVFDTFVRPHLSGMESINSMEQKEEIQSEDHEVENTENADIGDDANGADDDDGGDHIENEGNEQNKTIDDNDGQQNDGNDDQQNNEQKDNDGNGDDLKEEVLEEQEETESQEKSVENLLILAHSAGGSRTTYFLRERGSIIEKYIRAIAFTDIRDPKQQVFGYELDFKEHGGGYKEEAQIIKAIYKKCARNWVKTKTGKKLDAPMVKSKDCLVQKVSSGHEDHKYTTPSAFPSIIRFFEEKMDEIM